MTERRWLTSPPIHSHYHLFTGPDSRQTKHKDHAGEEKSSMLYKLCHKAEHNQTVTFSQHPQVSGKSPLCATLWNKHTSHTWSSKPAVTNKRNDGHTHREKVEKWHTAGTVVRAKTKPMYERCGLRLRFWWGWRKKSTFSVFQGKKRAQWIWRYGKEKQRDTEDRVKEIDLSFRTDTLHFYHSEGQRLVWQGWSSLVCSQALTAWREWMDCPAIPTKTHTVGKN